MLIPSLMNDYQKRMKTTGLRAYVRSSIMSYDSIDSYFSDYKKIEIKSNYVPGYASFQRSVDRFLINRKMNRTRSAKQVRSAVLNSFSLKSKARMIKAIHA